MENLLADVIGFVMLIGITAYSTAGGADFGAGIWDLLAGSGSALGREARALIDHAMAPVWEVNNVWLVLTIVVCWTGFPALFQAIFASLYPLFAIALIGLILRGAFFAFRHVADQPRAHRAADIVFGASSLVTPFFFAAGLGAIASGQVGLHGPVTSVLATCLNPMALAFGAVSVAATAFTGASFLAGDARRYGATELVAYFRFRTVVSGAVLILVGTAALAVIWVESPDLLRGMLLGPGTPFALATMILVPVVMALMWRSRFVLFRLFTVAAVGSLVLAWGFAQAPYMLPGHLTIAQAASPQSAQVLLVVVTLGVIIVIVPAMALLYYLDQQGALESPDH
jgi:cytochrome d ubiquinol oxidase subunit II